MDQCVARISGLSRYLNSSKKGDDYVNGRDSVSGFSGIGVCFVFGCAVLGRTQNHVEELT